MSIKLNLSVVDAINTLTALNQQSSKESELAGHENEDSKHNLKVIGKFDFNTGLTFSAQYETVFDLLLMRILVRKR